MGRCSADFKAAVLRYKYSSPTLSILERLFLNDFWSAVVYVYPEWLAPNLITLGGYACVVTAYCMTVRGSPDLDGSLESWQYLTSAALFFAYQTLDGSDGKQARRTGSGSALGELMDHGVDAITTGLLTVMVTDVFAFGIESMWVWVFLVAANTSFFLSNLTLVHAGQQKFFDLDVMEIQWVMILTIAAAGVVGTAAFASEGVPVPEALLGVQSDLFGLLRPEERLDLSSGVLPLRMVVVMGGLGGCAFNYPQYMWAAARPYLWLSKADQPQHIKDGAVGSGFGALVFQMLWVHAYAALFFLCSLAGTRLVASQSAAAAAADADASADASADADVARSALRALIVIACFAFGDMMDRLLLMRVAREPLPLVPPGLLPLALFLAACHTPAALPHLAHIAWALALATFGMHLSYFASSVAALAEALEIHPFKIGKRATTKAK